MAFANHGRGSQPSKSSRNCRNRSDASEQVSLLGSTGVSVYAPLGKSSGPTVSSWSTSNVAGQAAGACACAAGGARQPSAATSTASTASSDRALSHGRRRYGIRARSLRPGCLGDIRLAGAAASSREGESWVEGFLCTRSSSRALVSCLLAALPALAAKAHPRPRGAAGRRAAPRPPHRAPHRLAAAADDAQGEAQPADPALRRPDEGEPRRGPQAGRRRLQRDRPGADQPLPARRRRELAAAHPDPVRLRHDPRLPHDLPDPARRRQQLRPAGGPRPTTASAPSSPRRWASSRSTARWSTSRTSRAGAASPRPRARTRTSTRSWPRRA